MKKLTKILTGAFLITALAGGMTGCPAPDDETEQGDVSDFDTAKSNAKNTLDAIIKGGNYTDKHGNQFSWENYYPEQQNEIKNILTAAKTAVDNATTEQDLSRIRDEWESKIRGVKTKAQINAEKEKPTGNENETDPNGGNTTGDGNTPSPVTNIEFSISEFVGANPTSSIQRKKVSQALGGKLNELAAQAITMSGYKFANASSDFQDIWRRNQGYIADEFKTGRYMYKIPSDIAENGIIPTINRCLTYIIENFVPSNTSEGQLFKNCAQAFIDANALNQRIYGLNLTTEKETMLARINILLNKNIANLPDAIDELNVSLKSQIPADMTPYADMILQQLEDMSELDGFIANLNALGFGSIAPDRSGTISLETSAKPEKLAFLKPRAKAQSEHGIVV